MRRIWADGKLLDLTGLTIRVHPAARPGGRRFDPGQGGRRDSPAYRGLAYVVFENLPLADFGNRIPQFSFEIMRPVGALGRMAKAVTLIPGATEFGYEPSTAREHSRARYFAQEDATAPAPPRMYRPRSTIFRACAPVSSASHWWWRGSDRSALRPLHRAARRRDCRQRHHRRRWSVDGVTRPGAYLVSQIGGRPAFGGTPSDERAASDRGAESARA